MEILIPDFVPETLKNEYKKLATRLIELELLKEEIDLPVFNVMFFHYCMIIESMKAIQEKGTFQKDRHILRKNPAVQIFRESSAAFLKLAEKFGLFAANRDGILSSIIDSRSYKEQQIKRYGNKK